jgi:hypothetical protein
VYVVGFLASIRMPLIERARMKQAIPIRVGRTSAVAFALLALLALIVAPTCAPLCAANICSSNTAQGQCHEMANMGADGSERLVAPSRICSSPDFSAVLAKVDGQTPLSKGARNNSNQSLISRSSEQGLGGLHIDPEHWDVHRIPSRPADSLLLATILRI